MSTDPPRMEVRDYHKELLMDLLNRRPNHPVLEFPEWYDDANPDAYLQLVDLGLITGISYEKNKNGGLTVRVEPYVRLTGEGRRIAEAARRNLAVHPNKVFVSYVHDDSAQVDRLCGDLENAGVRTWRDIDRLLPGDDWKIAIR